MIDPEVMAAYQTKLHRHIGQRRVDHLQPREYVEPAVEAWEAALEARKVYGTKVDRTQTPRGKVNQG